MTNNQERPTAGSVFFKAHGHGNDYVVFAPGSAWTASEEAVQRVCDAHRGLGADGVVVVVDVGEYASLRMFNPDGGEFERSGNGLRVAALALKYWNRVDRDSFDVAIGGGHVRLTIHEEVGPGTVDVSAALGKAQLGPDAVAMDRGRFLASSAMADLDFVPVSVGNPHVVVFTDDLSNALLHSLGPQIATHPAIAHGTNVQFARVDADGAKIRIWERGVGPTSASGTSASAVAVASVGSGRLAAGRHRIQMDGGAFTVTVDESLDVTLRGPIQSIASGKLTEGFVRGLSL